PTMTWLDGLKTKVVEDAELHRMLLALLERTKSGVESQLASNDTAFMGLIMEKTCQLVEKYKDDETLLAAADDWIKKTVSQLVNKYHHEVGNMVRESLLKLDDQEMMQQIKEDRKSTRLNS